MSDYSQLDTSNEKHQIKLIEDYYKHTTKFDDDKIESLIQRLITDDALEEEAIDAQTYLLDYEKERKADLVESQRLRNEAIEQQAAEQRRLIDEAIERSSIVQGRRKNSIKGYMFNPIKKNGEVDTDFNRTLKAIASNPEHRVILADLLFDYKPEKGFDFSRYESKGQTRAARDIKKSLDEKLNTSLKGRKQHVPESTSKKTDWERILQNID